MEDISLKFGKSYQYNRKNYELKVIGREESIPDCRELCEEDQDRSIREALIL